MNKLITTRDYYLWVDTEAAIEAMVTPVFNEVAPWGEFKCTVSLSKDHPMSKDSNINIFEGIHAIIAHLPLHDDDPVLEGVLLLPQEKEDPFDCLKYTGNGDYNNGYMTGYREASQGKMYNEEDIKEAIKFGISVEAGNIVRNYKVSIEEQFLESLFPIPINFEPEYILNPSWGFSEDEPMYLGFRISKSTFRGKEVEVLQGRYLYG